MKIRRCSLFAFSRLRAFGSLGLFLLSAAPAQAGYYALVSQTGGLVTVTGPYGSYSEPYGASNPLDGSCHTDPNIYLYGGNSVDMSGTIKTVYQWKPALLYDVNNQPIRDASGQYVYDAADTPPDQVLVTESSTASAAAYPDGEENAEVYNGLGQGYKFFSFYDGFDGWSFYGLTSSSKRSRIIKGGPTLVIKCSPFVTATNDQAVLVPSVSYRVNVYPVTLKLDGITDANGMRNILIGQGVRGSLQIARGKLINYQWSIGGDTFKSYNAPLYGSKQKSAQVTYLTASDTASAAPH